MIASVHIADVAARRVLSLVRRAPDPASVPGLRSARVALALPLRTSLLPKVAFGRVGLVSFWDDDDALDAFESRDLASSPLLGGFRMRLRPLRAHGTWPGLDADVPASRQVAYDGLAAVLTLGRLRYSQTVRFLRASARAEAATANARGMIWGTAMARPPFVATCSLWESSDAIAAYAFDDPSAAHPARSRPDAPSRSITKRPSSASSPTRLRALSVGATRCRRARSPPAEGATSRSGNDRLPCRTPGIPGDDDTDVRRQIGWILVSLALLTGTAGPTAALAPPFANALSPGWLGSRSAAAPQAGVASIALPDTFATAKILVALVGADGPDTVPIGFATSETTARFSGGQLTWTRVAHVSARHDWTTPGGRVERFGASVAEVWVASPPPGWSGGQVVRVTLNHPNHRDDGFVVTIAAFANGRLLEATTADGLNARAEQKQLTVPDHSAVYAATFNGQRNADFTPLVGYHRALQRRAGDDTAAVIASDGRDLAGGMQTVGFTSPEPGNFWEMAVAVIGVRASAGDRPCSRAEPVVEQTRHRPGAVGRVRYHGVCDVSARVVHTAKRHTGVAPFQHHDGRRRMEPEAEAVSQRAAWHGALRSHHLVDPLARHDAVTGERLPERVQVGRGRVETAVAAAAHREVERVGSLAVDGEVPERGAGR